MADAISARGDSRKPGRPYEGGREVEKRRGDAQTHGNNAERQQCDDRHHEAYGNRGESQGADGGSDPNQYGSGDNGGRGTRDDARCDGEGDRGAYRNRHASTGGPLPNPSVSPGVEGGSDVNCGL